MSGWRLKHEISEHVGGAHAYLELGSGTDDARTVHIVGPAAAVKALADAACGASAEVKAPASSVWRVLITGGGGAFAAMLYEAPAGKDGDLTLEDLNAIEQNASHILKCEAVAMSWVRLSTASPLSSRATDTACDPVSSEEEIPPQPRDTTTEAPRGDDGTLPFTPRTA